MQDESHSMKQVAYTRGYYRMLSPVNIVTALELQGIAPPDLERPLNYCELGMGFGVSLLLHAACLPHMRFHGIDFNPEHVAYARALAGAAELHNVNLLEAGFDDLARSDLPQMDIIVLHGIWSWISPRLRGVIVDFMQRRLAPGGVVCISHNLRTGWASLEPLRELVLRHVARVAPQANPVERLAAAKDYAQRLRVAWADYLEDNPQAGRWIDRLDSMDPSYLVHELLTEHWHPQHFHEVAAELAPAGLEHAGMASIPMLVDERWLSTHARAALAAEPDPAARASLRDLLFNPPMRRDLYVRGAAQLNNGQREQRCLDRQWLATSLLDDDGVTAIYGQDSELASQRDVMIVLDALSEGPMSVRCLLQSGRLSEWPLPRLLRVLQLLDGDHVQPALPPHLHENGLRGARRLNDIVLDRAGTDGLNFLANPASGIAIGWSTPVLRQLDRYRRGARDPQSLAQAWAQEGASEQGLAQRVVRFLERRAPALSLLGVL